MAKNKRDSKSTEEELEILNQELGITNLSFYEHFNFAKTLALSFGPTHPKYEKINDQANKINDKTKEIAARNRKSEQLKVLETDDGQFFVESGEGKILYNVVLGDDRNTCTCGDYAINIKKDSNFTCKHILSVMNAIPKKEVENAKFIERPVPRLDDRFMTNIKGKDFVLYAGVLDLATMAYDHTILSP